MKLIIDISKDVYTRLFDNGIQDNEIAVDDICEIARALRIGTPLDDVIGKIEALPKTYPFVNHIDTYVKEDDVLQILDNIGKAEKGGE